MWGVEAASHIRLPVVRIAQTGQSVETESRFLVARGWER